MANFKVPLLDLKTQYQSIKPEIDAAIARVLDSGQFVLGAEVAGFEQEFATYCGAGECIALNSGTSALHLALLAAGVGPGDEVITVPFTFVASVAAVVYTGARPVLVDIDSRSFTIDPAAIEAAITNIPGDGCKSADHGGLCGRQPSARARLVAVHFDPGL